MFRNKYYMFFCINNNYLNANNENSGEKKNGGKQYNNNTFYLASNKYIFIANKNTKHIESSGKRSVYREIHTLLFILSSSLNAKCTINILV
jgi:hypothetical protein